MRRFRNTLMSLLAFAGTARAATLPDHRPLDVIVIGDEVNPNGLSDENLTQPKDIPEALNAPDSGLHLVSGGAQGFDSQCIDKALERLDSDPAPDVVVYFAHRAARSCGGADVQPRLTSAIEALLTRGGGFVVFHHGIYRATGKERILELIGAESNSISWNTSEGQRVIAVAPEHFIAKNGVTYPDMTTLPDFSGVSAGTYPSFVNVPDERYPVTTLSAASGATRTVLFASNSGGNRVLSFVLSRPSWKGRVVTYQPGEYQPNALDKRNGNNFQILANAILFSAARVDEMGRPTDPTMSGGTGGVGGGSSGSAGANGKAGAGGSGSAVGGTSASAGGSSSHAGGSSASAGANTGGDARGGTFTGSGGTSNSGQTGTSTHGAQGGASSGGASPAATGGAKGERSEGGHVGAAAHGTSSSGCSVAPARNNENTSLARLVFGALASAVLLRARRGARRASEQPGGLTRTARQGR